MGENTATMSMPYLNLSWGSINIITLLIAIGISIILSVFVIKRNRRLWFTAILFNLYFIALVIITTSDNPNSSGVISSLSERIELVPLIGIINAIKYNISQTYIQFFLNIVMFIPLGVLLPVLYKKIRSYWKIALLSFLFSLGIELIQWLWIGSNRIFEIDDILCNTVGALVGYSIWKLCICIKKSDCRKVSNFIVPVFLCLAFVLLGLRPCMVFDSDMLMTESYMRVPSQIISSDDIEHEDVAEMEIYNVSEDSGTYLFTVVEELGLFELEKISNADQQYVQPTDMFVSVISHDDAIQRAQQGIIIAADSMYIIKPDEVTITKADLAYMISKNGTQLRPVWVLSGKITKYDINEFTIENDNGELEQLQNGDEDKLNEEHLMARIIVPAEA